MFSRSNIPQAGTKLVFKQSDSDAFDQKGDKFGLPHSGAILTFLTFFASPQPTQKL